MSDNPAPVPSLTTRALAEALGSFWLVLGGCGAAVIAGDDIGNLGIAAAFGLSVLSGAYAVGHLSGGHFNPAVTLGLASAKRFAWRDVPAYVAAQLLAAVAAAAVLFAIANGRPGFDAADGFATNGYGSASPAGYDLWAVVVTEVVLSAVFVLVILGATDTRAPKGFAPLAIGLTLTLIHLIAIPVDNTSVNPARSIGPALFAGGTAISQLWVFIVAPIVGALLAGLAYGPILSARRTASLQESASA